MHRPQPSIKTYAAVIFGHKLSNCYFGGLAANCVCLHTTGACTSPSAASPSGLAASLLYAHFFQPRLPAKRRGLAAPRTNTPTVTTVSLSSCSAESHLMQVRRRNTYYDRGSPLSPVPQHHRLSHDLSRQRPANYRFPQNSLLLVLVLRCLPPLTASEHAPRRRVSASATAHSLTVSSLVAFWKLILHDSLTRPTKARDSGISPRGSLSSLPAPTVCPRALVLAAV